MLSTITRDVLATAFLLITRNPIQAAQAGGLAAAIADAQSPNFRPEAARTRADVACVAIQLASAIAEQPDLLQELLTGTPVVSVTVHDPQAMEVAEGLMEECFAVSREGVVRMMSVFTANGPPVISYRAPILDALAAGQAVFGLRTPSFPLDPTLEAAVDFRVVLGPIDREVIGAVIKAVTGEGPAREVDESVLRDLPLSSLPIAIRSQWTAAQCIERLERPIKAVASTPPSIANPQRGDRAEDLVGYGIAKDWALGAVEDLKAWKAGKLAWSEASSRMLISGAPGVGKTLLARAIAYSAGAKLIETSVADWCSQKYLNATLTEMKRVFAEARKSAPCVLLLDEADGLSDRSRLQGDNVEYWTQIINAVLVQLNEPADGVVIVAATNFPERIDPAVLRSGRLDRHIRIEVPSATELVDVFRHHLRGDLTGEDLTGVALAAMGGTGADVESWVRHGRVAARRAGRSLTIEDLKQSITSIRIPFSADERRRIACHEAGHALASWALQIGKLDGVAINARGGSTVLELPFRGSAVLGDIEKEMVLLLAGMAAEVAMLGGSSIGAGVGPTSDLARATEIALAIECKYGIGELGTIYSPAEASDVVRNPILFNAVRKRLAAAEKRAGDLVAEHRRTLELLANELDRQGYLSADDVRRITRAFDSKERLVS